MATTRKLTSIEFVMDEATGAIAETMLVFAMEQPPVDPDNPAYPVPERPFIVRVPVANLPAGGQTQIENLITFVQGKLDTDRPLV